MNERRSRTVSPSARWFPYHKPGGTPALRLFCMPYAGGAAAVYRDWPAGLPSGVEVMSVQYPGRGARLMEEPIRYMEPLVRATVGAMLPFLDRPFAFFGYSMGALLAFEVARVLRGRYGLQPEKLFVAACHDPVGAELQHTRRHSMPLPELIAELERLNGTPREILDDPAALECFLPALRADFEVVDTYAYRAEGPLGCPIQAFGGRQDNISLEELGRWASHTTAGFSLEMLDGDHFFILQDGSALLDLVARELELWVDSSQLTVDGAPLLAPSFVNR